MLSGDVGSDTKQITSSNSVTLSFSSFLLLSFSRSSSCSYSISCSSSCSYSCCSSYVLVFNTVVCSNYVTRRYSISVLISVPLCSMKPYSMVVLRQKIIRRSSPQRTAVNRPSPALLPGSPGRPSGRHQWAARTTTMCSSLR